MPRLLVPFWCLTLLLTSALRAAETTATETPAPPPQAGRSNIVLIVIDDLGYGETGCQGNQQIPTPKIDSIARNGVRFTQGYVTAPYCSPSRAGLLTGRYQTRFGHEWNPTGAQNLRPDVGLPRDQKTIADRLSAVGYATGMVGKWHLGGHDDFHPQRRGFGEFFGFLHEGHTFAPPSFPGLVTHLRVREPPYDQDNPLLRGNKPVDEKANLTTAFAREASAFIEVNQRKPFFLYVPFNAVHSPMQASPRYFDKFRHIDDIHRRVFAAMLAELDDAIGTILERIDTLGLVERTLVIFLSDNGGPTAELTSRNTPLRGGKGQLFEGGIRVPYLMQWKGKLPAGRVYEPPVLSLDATATALVAAGVPLPQDSDGVDLLPFLAATPGRAAPSDKPRNTLFWRYGNNVAVRVGDLKLVKQSPPGQGGSFQLFDLADDPGETRDLSSERPEEVRRMTAELEKINGTMVPPAWTPTK